MGFSKKRLEREINLEFGCLMPEIREEHLEAVIVQAKEVYEKQGRRERTGFLGLLFRQIRFIGWKVWLMQSGLLLLLTCMIRFVFKVSEPAAHIPNILCGSGILMAWATVPMLERSIRYRMFEIENTALFSGGRLMLARLMIVLGGNLVIITVLMCLMTARYLYSFRDVVFSFVLPLMAAASLFLCLFRRLKMQSVIKGCNLAGGISIVLVFLMDRWKAYNLTDLPQEAGWLLCTVCLVLCIMQIRKTAERESYEEVPEFC